PRRDRRARLLPLPRSVVEEATREAPRDRRSGDRSGDAAPRRGRRAPGADRRARPRRGLRGAPLAASRPRGGWRPARLAAAREKPPRRAQQPRETRRPRRAPRVSAALSPRHWLGIVIVTREVCPLLTTVPEPTVRPSAVLHTM